MARVAMPKMDWNNREQVIAFAKKLGQWQTVYKNKHRENYNITHTARPDMWKHIDNVVVFQT